VRFRDVATEQWFRMSSKSVATARAPFELKPAGGLTPCGTFEVMLKAIEDDSSKVVKSMDAPLKVTLIQGEISGPSATGGAAWIDVWWTWVGASDAENKLMFREAEAENTGFIWVPVKELPTARTPYRLKAKMLKPLTRYQLYVKVEVGDDEVRSKTIDVLTAAAGPTAKIEGTNTQGNTFKVRLKTYHVSSISSYCRLIRRYGGLIQAPRRPNSLFTADSRRIPVHHGRTCRVMQYVTRRTLSTTIQNTGWSPAKIIRSVSKQRGEAAMERSQVRVR